MQVNESPARHISGERIYLTGDIVNSILDLPSGALLGFNPKAEIEIGDWVGVSFIDCPRFGFLAQVVSPDCFRIDSVTPELETLFLPLSLLRIHGKFTRAVEKMSFEHVQIPSAN
jgi:hypothetical protein